jgi:hypothetical protein
MAIERLGLLRLLGCLPLKNEATSSGGWRPRSLGGGNRGPALDLTERGIDPIGQRLARVVKSCSAQAIAGEGGRYWSDSRPIADNPVLRDLVTA